MAKEEVLGYADFGAYMHRDNGGKMKVAAYTSVNKPLKIDGNHDETTKIASRRYKIVEEERAELNGAKFYEKDVWNVQEGGESPVKGNNKYSEKEYDEEPPQAQQSSGHDKFSVLKNFVDNIAADVREHKSMIIPLMIGTAIVAVGGLVIAVMVALR